MLRIAKVFFSLFPFFFLMILLLLYKRCGESPNIMPFLSLHNFFFHQVICWRCLSYSLEYITNTCLQSALVLQNFPTERREKNLYFIIMRKNCTLEKNAFLFILSRLNWCGLYYYWVLRSLLVIVGCDNKRKGKIKFSTKKRWWW